MNLTLIAAIGKNGEIGKNNDLIWHLKEDLKFFRKNTINKQIVMGRKTLESLPKLLPKRKHLVLTHQDLDIEGVKTFKSKEELLEYLKEYDEEIMIIGGASIYSEFIDLANRMLLTEIDAEYLEADKFFPEYNKEEWKYEILDTNEENNIEYKHIEYVRKLEK